MYHYSTQIRIALMVFGYQKRGLMVRLNDRIIPGRLEKEKFLFCKIYDRGHHM